MKKEHLLWVDDEIDILKPHILFLESKGYAVSTATNGQDALELCKGDSFDQYEQCIVVPNGKTFNELFLYALIGFCE